MLLSRVKWSRSPAVVDELCVLKKIALVAAVGRWSREKPEVISVHLVIIIPLCHTVTVTVIAHKEGAVPLVL